MESFGNVDITESLHARVAAIDATELGTTPVANLPSELHAPAEQLRQPMLPESKYPCPDKYKYEDATPCYDQNDLFFAPIGESKPDRDKRVTKAKGLCANCDVKKACLKAALSRKEPWGIWGGEELRHGEII